MARVGRAPLGETRGLLAGRENRVAPDRWRRRRGPGVAVMASSDGDRNHHAERGEDGLPALDRIREIPTETYTSA